MNTKQLQKNSLLLTTPKNKLDILKTIRGIWKKKKLNPVKYQRKLRDHADHVTL